MKRLAAALVLVFGLSAFNCGTLKTPDPTGPVASCLATNLIPDVNNALANDNWTGALLQLVLQCGQAVISEVVQYVGGESTRAAMSTSDPLESLKSSRASAYLAEHPVK